MTNPSDTVFAAPGHITRTMADFVTGEASRMLKRLQTALETVNRSEPDGDQRRYIVWLK